MIVTVDYIVCSDFSKISKRFYHHMQHGLVNVVEIDMGSNRSRVILLSGQTIWINNSQLYELVISEFPLNPDSFKPKDTFYYYQLGRNHPTSEPVLAKDAKGILGEHSKFLISWDTIFNVIGYLDIDDYKQVSVDRLVHKQIEVDYYPEEEVYFIKNEYDRLNIDGILFEEEKVRKSLYKQGFTLTKR